MSANRSGLLKRSFVSCIQLSWLPTSHRPSSDHNRTGSTPRKHPVWFHKNDDPFPPSPSAVQLSKGACHRGNQQIIATLSNDLNPSIWAPTTVYGEKLYKKISVSLVVVDIYIYIYRQIAIIPTSELVGHFGQDSLIENHHLGWLLDGLVAVICPDQWVVFLVQEKRLRMIFQTLPKKKAR